MTGSTSTATKRQWLDNLLREKCNVRALRDFQLDHAMDLESGKDLFLVIATGQGKTIVLHAALIAAQARGESGIGLLIVPTKALAEQQETVARKHGLRAFALTEDTVRNAFLRGRDLFAELASEDGIRLAVMSPQMLRGDRLGKLMRIPSFRDSIRWMLIDEAHLVDDDESGTFVVAYKAISVMRARLPSKTIWAAVTGSISPAAALSVASKLGFRRGHYVNARYSLNRPNIKYIPRFFEHAVSGHTFLDLSFLIPRNMTSIQQITPTLIFTTTINTGHSIMQYLDSLLPKSIPNRLQIIKLYNAIMPLDYRHDFLRDIIDGSVLRIGVVTDTLTYGLDIPNLPRVVLFDMCPSPENQKQKVGRCGRNGEPAIAITFAPSWVRIVADENLTSKQAKLDAQRRAKLPTVTLNWYNPTPGRCSRRAVQDHDGEEFIPTLRCCSMCQEGPEMAEDHAMVMEWKSHFDSHATNQRAKALRSDNTYKALDQPMKDSLFKLLERWRAQKWAQIRGDRLGYASNYFLPRRILLQVVDRAHICTTLDRLKVVTEGWNHADEYGADLFEYLTRLLIGFNEILTEPVSEPEDSAEVTPISAHAAPSQQQTRVRLILGSRSLNNTSTTQGEKRASSPLQSPKPSKRSRRKNKEN